MSNATVGAFVRINPTAFGDKPKYDDMYGDLGYVGVLMHLIWEVVKIEKDSARGEIAWCRITNPDILLSIVPGVKKVVHEGEAVLLVKDLVPANMKTTLNYVIEETSNPNAKEIAALFAARKKMQNQGKTKDDSNMKKNWKNIELLRAANPTEFKVLLPKHNLFFMFNKKDLPDDSEESITKFKNVLANKVRGMRNGRKEFDSKHIKTLDVFGVGVEKRGGVFSEAGSLLKAYEESLKVGLETPKKPVDKAANYVGIEIEFIYRGDYDILRKLLISQRLHRFVDLTSDGSLRACHGTNGYDTREMRIICKTSEIQSVLARLQKVFNHPKVDAYTNRSCGLHVHTDMRNRKVGLAYTNFVRVQKILRGAQPSGRLANTHCKANDYDKVDFNKPERPPRYSVVNASSYDKHKTLEIRIHEGTVNCDDIYNWVMFIDAIASHPTEIPVNSITKASELASLNITIPAESIKYLDYRIEKFDSLSVG